MAQMFSPEVSEPDFLQPVSASDGPLFHSTVGTVSREAQREFEHFGERVRLLVEQNERNFSDQRFRSPQLSARQLQLMSD